MDWFLTHFYSECPELFGDHDKVKIIVGFVSVQNESLTDAKI
jgi:hypothetical protein